MPARARHSWFSSAVFLKAGGDVAVTRLAGLSASRCGESVVGSTCFVLSDAANWALLEAVARQILLGNR